MTELRTHADEIAAQFSDHIDVETDEIEQRLEQVVTEYKIPIDEARRTVTNSLLDEADIDAEIVEVTGATELTPHAGMADAIVDITSTGTTLQVNRLAIIDAVLQSSVRLFAREDVLEDPKLKQIQTALESVLAAEGKRYLMMNVPRDRLEEVRDVIPGLGGPTIMDIADDEDGTLAVHVVVDERDVFEVITNLKAAGASDILVTEIERLVE